MCHRDYICYTIDGTGGPVAGRPAPLRVVAVASGNISVPITEWDGSKDIFMIRKRMRM